MTSLAALTRADRLAMLVFCAAILTATAFDGATTHAPAWLLRAAVVVLAVAVWPPALSLRPAEVVIPGAALTLCLAGWLAAPEPGVALQAAVSALLVVLLFVAVRGSERDLGGGAAALLVLVAAAHSVWAIAERLGGGERGSAGFFSPSDLGALLAPAWVAAVGAPLPPRWRWPLVALLSGGLVASASRAALLAVAIAGVILLAARLRLRAGLALAAVAAALAAAVLLSLPRWQTEGDRYAFSRVQMWQRSLELVWQHPLGVGLGGYEPALRRAGVALDGPVRYPKIANHGHSEAVHNLVELGWPGLLVTLLPTLLLVAALRRQRRAGLPVAAHWAMLAAFALPAAVSMSLRLPPVAFAAAAWAATLLRREPGTLRWTPRRPRLVPAAVGAAALVVTLLPAASQLSMQRAATLRERGQAAAARTWAERATALAPWSAGAVMLEQSLRFAAGAPAEHVAAVLVGLADAHPHDPQPLRRAVWLLQQEGRQGPLPPAAWRSLAALQRQVIERDPLNVLDHVTLADFLLAAGDREEAEKALAEALRIEPLCAAAHAHLALLAHQDGDQARAAQALERVGEALGHAGGYHGYGRDVLSLPERLRTMLAEEGLTPP